MNVMTTAPIDCSAPDGPTPTHGSFTQQLAIPPKVDRRTSTSVVKLIMKSGTHQFSPDLPATPTFGYALTSAATDVYGGPTIEAAKGVPVRLAVTNALGAHPLANYVDTAVMGTEAGDAAMPRGTVHLHGAHTEAKYDGLPNSTFGVGQSDTYVYGNDQDATGLWYHDHAWGLTRLQVTAGLAGQYWLRDKWDTGNVDNPLHLPVGPFEVPLTLQDRTFNADGKFAYPIGPHCGVPNLPAGYPNQWNPESFGDVATVNGVIEPNFTVSHAVYRFRTLNGSNARFYHLRIEQVDAAGNLTGNVLPFFQIGSDGGLLNAPARLTSLLMAPAERADLLVDFSSLPSGSKWRVMNDALAPYPDGGDGDLPQVMQFTVGRTTGPRGTVPATLRGGRGQPALLPVAVGKGGAAAPGALKATSVRTIFLNEIADNITDPADLEGEPVHVMMGNKFYASDATMQPRTTDVEAPKINSVEEWDIVNTTGDAHPIHLHLTQFRLLNRQAITVDPGTGETHYLTDNLNCGGADADPAACVASPGLPNPQVAGSGPWPAPSPAQYLDGAAVGPTANEAGWKDTIVAMPGTVTRIIVPFGGTAAGIPAPYVGDTKTAATQRFTGVYVFHCHILEHEDNDMMSPLNVH
jgi:FtsP/CotA-like multicopper oxidase with cupredoxin domain